MVDRELWGEARERAVQKRAEASFKDHVIEERCNQGLFRAWRCQRPEHLPWGGGSWFDITLIPGSAIVTGDIGELIVSRHEDMLPWLRGSVHSTYYFASKVPRAIPTTEFSYNVFKAAMQEWLADPEHQLDQEDLTDTERTTLQAQRELVEDTLDASDELPEAELYDRLQDLYDGCDYPNWHDYTLNFLNCREALRWFVTHYENPPVSQA